jgi:WD40 repeat protein
MSPPLQHLLVAACLVLPRPSVLAEEPLPPLPPEAIARLVAPPVSQSQVLAVATSADGKFLAALGSGGTVFVWRDGEPVATTVQGSGAVALAPDGKWLAAGQSGGSVALHGRLPATNTTMPLGQHKGAVNCLGFAACAPLLASGGDDNQVRLWDPAQGKALRVLEGHQGLVCAVAVSPDGKRVASASLDLTLRLWDAASGKELRRLAGNGDQIRGLAFSADGRRLFSAGMDRLARAWDVTSGKEVRRFEGHRQGVRGLALSPDGRTLATASDDGTVRLWDVQTGHQQRCLDVCPEGVNAVAFRPDGSGLVTGDAARAVRCWNLRRGGEVRALTLPGAPPQRATMALHSVAWSPDGRLLATGGEDRSVRLWDAAGRPVRLLGRQVDVVWSVAFSPDGRTLASAGRRDGLVHLWDVSTGAEVYRCGGVHRGGVSRVAWSADGRLLVSTGGSFDPSVHLWDGTSGRHLRRLGGHRDFIAALAVSPDGQRVASASTGGSLQRWELTTGRHQDVPLDSVDGLAFAPGGELVIVGEGTLLVWDPAAEQPCPLGRAFGCITSAVAYSPDGRTLAAGMGDNDVYLWEAATGRRRARFGGHHAPVTSLAFRPDGRALASAEAGLAPAGTGGTVFVWDLTGPTCDRPRKPPSEEDLAVLGGADAEAAYRMLWRLVAAGDSSVALLRRRLRPAPAAPAGRIDGWIRDLDSDDFRTREQAARELQCAADTAVPALRRALAASPSPEVRRRIDDLLHASMLVTSPEALRTLRGLEALEQIGTPAARDVLRDMSRGEPDARATREARMALGRLQRR